MLRLLLGGMRDCGVFLIDAAGRVASWNSGAARLHGYTAEEIVGQPYDQLYPPEDRNAGAPARALRIAAEHGRFQTQGWRLRNDGRRFWADVVIDAIYGEDGSLYGYAKVTRDASPQREAAEVLRLSEERFRRMVGGVVDYAIYWLDPEGHITSWNSGAERIEGYTADEVLGSHFSRFYDEDERRRGEPERALARAAAEGSHVGEGWRIRKDGSRYWATAVIDRILDGDGHLAGFAKITRDDTERRHQHLALEEAYALLERRVAERTRELTQRNDELKAINAELRAARREAEDAVRARSQFLAAASHDLRQPFQALRLFYELAAHQNRDPAVSPALAGLGAALTAGEELLQALLEVSALDAGVVEPALVAVDLGALLGELAAETYGSAEAKGLRLKLRAQRLVVRSDPALLKRVLRKLLQNAIRYTVRGGVVLTARRQGDKVAVVVCDTGIGIPPESVDDIFRDFYQLHNPERDRAKGLGLGLSVVRRVTELLGHQMRVRSRPGLGSVFAVVMDPEPEITSPA